MEVGELRNLHSWVRHTVLSEIVFVSAPILPIYLLIYDYSAERISPASRSFVSLRH